MGILSLMRQGNVHLIAYEKCNGMIKMANKNKFVLPFICLKLMLLLSVLFMADNELSFTYIWSKSSRRKSEAEYGGIWRLVLGL